MQLVTKDTGIKVMRDMTTVYQEGGWGNEGVETLMVDMQ
jgi:hypothetical protein